MFGQDLTIGSALTEWAINEVVSRVQPALELRARKDISGDPGLWDFQRVMVAFTRTAGSALNATEMRLGKTVETAVDMRDSRSVPALVVCNNSMKDRWADELRRWAPDLRVTVLRGGATTIRKKADEDADVFIVNWESLWRHSRLAPYGSIRLTERDLELGVLNRDWALVVADEAHRAKDPRAKQTRALWAVGQTAKRRVALTGTPIANAPDDLWSVMHFVEPDDWPAKTRFIDRYCMLGVAVWGGIEVIGLRPDTRDEFFRILDPRYKRDTRAEHMDIPTVYTYRIVEMHPKQAKAYKQMKDFMLAELDGGEAVTTNPLAQHVRLSQFASAYAQFEDGEVRLT
ncbi:MAG: SNF2-related protein, partial [Vicinamibacterales bacterium]